MHLKIFLLTITANLIFQTINIYGQNRWIKTYHENADVYIENISESYDNGYLLSGKFGPNYSKYNWLIKTNINGEILWEKTIGDGLKAIGLWDISQDDNGSIYLCGSTLSYDPYSDPLIIKLDSCGEKQWCRDFYTENNTDYAMCFTLTPEGNIVVVLFLTNPESWVDRICLAKLSSDGELVWKQCYTTTDSSQRNEVPLNIILTPDQGFLITGYCDYEDPTYPNRWWLHPYYLKVDSAGNFQWETIIYKETERDGGMGWTTVLSPSQQFYYSSISHHHHDTVFRCPALAKIDLQGNVVAVYDVAHGYKYGKMVDAQFFNDSMLAASAGWGDTDDSLWSKAVIIDTLGNLLNSRVLVEDIYTSLLQVTFDGKLLYAFNTLQNDEFDVYLTKLNQNLEDDTIYTRPFTYDSLCPYQIASDTIVQDDCGLIVGVEEPGSGEAGKRGGGEAGKQGRLEIWPNPAKTIVNCQLSTVDFQYNSTFSIEDISLVIYDVFGREVAANMISSPRVGGGREGGWTVDISSLSPGMYIVFCKDKENRMYSGKFIKSLE
jgi:hypothetical protein